jgi:hypothetical protein
MKRSELRARPKLSKKDLMYETNKLLGDILAQLKTPAAASDVEWHDQCVPKLWYDILAAIISFGLNHTVEDERDETEDYVLGSLNTIDAIAAAFVAQWVVDDGVEHGAIKDAVEFYKYPSEESIKKSLMEFVHKLYMRRDRMRMNKEQLLKILTSNNGITIYEAVGKARELYSREFGHLSDSKIRPIIAEAAKQLINDGLAHVELNRFVYRLFSGPSPMHGVGKYKHDRERGTDQGQDSPEPTQDSQSEPRISETTPEGSDPSGESGKG